MRRDSLESRRMGTLTETDTEAIRLEMLSPTTRRIHLVGAGVSMLPPTCLPSGNTLRDRVIEAICAAPTLKRELAAVQSSSRWDRLLPEHVFQEVFEFVTASFVSIVGSMDTAPFNSAHSYFAERTRIGEHVLTTNFDSLIEVSGADTALVHHLHGALSGDGGVVHRLSDVHMGLGQTAGLLVTRPQRRSQPLSEKCS